MKPIIRVVGVVKKECPIVMLSDARKPCVWLLCFAFVLFRSLIDGPYSWVLVKAPSFHGFNHIADTERAYLLRAYGMKTKVQGSKLMLHFLEKVTES